MLLTAAQCRAKAEEKTGLAEREPRHRRRLLSAARGWTLVADRIEETDSSINNAQNRARKADDPDMA